MGNQWDKEGTNKAGGKTWQEDKDKDWNLDKTETSLLMVLTHKNRRNPIQKNFKMRPYIHTPQGRYMHEYRFKLTVIGFNCLED